jgi:hypothetical protein
MTSKNTGRPVATSKPATMTREAEAAVRFLSELRAVGLGAGASPAIDDGMLVPTLTAAGLVGVKQQTLAIWRCEPNRNRALPYVLVGRRVFYRYGDIRRFIDRNLHVPKVAA